MDDLSAVMPPCRTMLPILEVQHVTKRFAFGAEAIDALADASLRDREGRVRLPDRRLRLRQVDPAAHGRRLRDGDRRARC